MRHLSLRVSARAFVVVLAVLAAGCTTAGAPEPSATMPNLTEDGSAWAYFIDTGDSGDDIWTAGCHYKCSDTDCTGPTEFWGGDSCAGNSVQEWTNSAPHAAESDIERHDCEEACKEKGSSGGRCVRVERACDGAYPSSRCECDGS